MARLIDKLLQTSFQTKAFKSFIDVLPNAEIIVADNVAKHYFDNADKGWEPKYFPNIAPPFELFFIDFRMFGTSSAEFAGCLFWSVDLQNGDEIENSEILANVTNGINIANKDEIRWCLTCIPFMTRKSIKNLVPEPLYSVTMLVKTNGEMVYGDNHWPAMQMAFDNQRIERVASLNNLSSDEFKTLLAQLFKQIGYPALLAISFMHCKNVTLKKETPPVALSKKYAKNHGRPLVSYHTLNIEPMKTILRTEGNSEKTGLKQALHICRGHFKDFSKGKGLFGRYKGLYFWESQVRGSVSEGIVDKDYAVKSPKVTA